MCAAFLTSDMSDRVVRGYPPVCRNLFVCILLCSASVVADSSAEFYGKKIREIRISGLRHTKEAIVRAQLASTVGEPFRADSIERDTARLDRLGIFSSIRIAPETFEDGVLLGVELEETLWLLPYPSFNLTDENGLSYGAGVKAISVLGSGTNLSTSARFGGLTDVEVLLRSPSLARKHVWYGTDYYYRDRPNTLDSFQENANEFDGRVGLQPREDLRVGGRFSLMTMSSDVSGITLSSSGRDTIPAVGLLVEHDTRDLRSNPHRGWWNSADVTKSGGFLGGSADFVTSNLDVRRYQPVAERHTVFVSSLVTLQAGPVGEGIPVYRDFHIGGTNTIRGWDLNARQGKNQFINTLEYRYEVLKPKRMRIGGVGFYAGVHIAAFADLGTAWSENADFTRNFIGGGGFGVRLVVPFIDMVRIDFGFGQGNAGLVRHFGIREKAYYQRLRVR